MGITAAALKFGIPLALNIGHSIFKGRDMSKAQKKAEEENRRAQAMSNLINALSSSAQHQPYLQEPEYRPSGLTRALGAASLGYDVYSGLKSVAAKEAREKTENEIKRLALKKATEDAAIRAGKAFAAQVPKGTEVTDDLRSVIDQFGPDQPPSFRVGVSEGLKTLEDDRVQRILQEESLKALEDQREERERLAAVTKGEDFAAQMPPGVEPGTPEWDRFKSVMAQFGQREPGVQTGVSEAFEAREKEAIERELKEAQAEYYREKAAAKVSPANSATAIANAQMATLAKGIVEDGNYQLYRSASKQVQDRLFGFMAMHEDFDPTLAGKTMTATDRGKIDRANNARWLVAKTREQFVQYEELVGPYAGLSLPMFQATKAQQIRKAMQQNITLTTQRVGIMFEEASLRDADWEKYVQNLPKATDKFDVAMTKFNEIDEIIDSGVDRVVSGLRQEGFFVPEYEEYPSLDELSEKIKRLLEEGETVETDDPVVYGTYR